MPLTAKQSAFVREYAIDYNAAAAARRAGYSERTADRTGYDLLRKPEIATAVEQLQVEAEAKALVTREQVIHGLLSEAEYYGEGGSHSARVAAWSHLGKHLGLFTDKVENTHRFDGIVGIDVHLANDD